MSIQEKDTYFVAVKIFLEKDGKFLVMKDTLAIGTCLVAG